MVNIDSRGLVIACRLWNERSATADSAELARAICRIRDEMEAMRRELDENERLLIERLVAELGGAPPERRYGFRNPPPAPK